MSGEIVKIPNVLPGAVRAQLAYMLTSPITTDQLEVLKRLARDTRMINVWNELIRTDRKTGAFLYPAQHPAEESFANPAEAQAAALRETLHFAYKAAIDRVRVFKPAEIEQKRQELLNNAETFRARAEELAQIGAEEVPYILAAATRYEAAAGEVRKDDDPLTISNDRGDRVERGVQIAIASFLLERFGNRLDGVASTLTSVALGTNKPSARVSRSAFLEAKRR